MSRQEQAATMLRNLDLLPNDRLLYQYEVLLKRQELAVDEVNRIAVEILKRAEAAGGTAIVDEVYDCPITSTANYDRSAFTPLLEIFNHDDLAMCYEPAHFTTIEVPAKWDLVKVKPLVAKYGNAAKEIMDRATLAPTRRIGKFGRKEGS